MVELKVRKFGNSLGVVLPKDVINRLQTGDGEKLFLIEAADGDYRLTPYDPSFEKTMEKAEQIMSRYRNALRALSKSGGNVLSRLMSAMLWLSTTDFWRCTA